MNPVLLKPQADHTSQLVVQGQVRGTLHSGDFRGGRAPLLGPVLESFHRISRQCDIVVVEGAGSPAETNLRAGDIANMGFARAADVPVVLVGDIDRGGVIAAIVGTKTVLDPEDAAMIHGFIINKFRGDPSLFTDGYRHIEALTGWRGFGIVPWIAAVARLPSEDAVVLERVPSGSCAPTMIACPVLPRISNFDDLDPLRLEPSVELIMVPPGTPIPAAAALVVIPGSKATIADLAFLRAEGWDIDIAAHYRRGGSVLGLCGGFQMLGRRVSDPDGLEGSPSDVAGLGLLDVETVMSPGKTLRHTVGVALGQTFAGYEMHLGETSGADCCRPFARLDDARDDGAISADGRVLGSYVHGLLASTELRRALLARIGGVSSGADYGASVEGALDELAEALEKHVDVDALVALATHTPMPSRSPF